MRDEMRDEMINMLLKLVNAIAWAFLVKVMLTATFEIAKYTAKLPENVAYESYINQLVVIVFLVVISTYRFSLPKQDGQGIKTETILKAMAMINEKRAYEATSSEEDMTMVGKNLKGLGEIEDKLAKAKESRTNFFPPEPKTDELDALLDNLKKR